MRAPLKIRPYRPSDLEGLIQLFTTSVRQVASRDYTAAQIEAWAPLAVNRDQWAARLGAKPTFVAERASEIAGFSDLEADGRIDMMFVHADHQRQGVARALLAHIVLKASEQGISSLFTEASLTAKPFFEQQGFVVLEAQDVQLRGQTFRNFRMSRAL